MAQKTGVAFLGYEENRADHSMKVQKDKAYSHAHTLFLHYYAKYVT